jgi:Sec-independent protein translocase protein TatA
LRIIIIIFKKDCVKISLSVAISRIAHIQGHQFLIALIIPHIRKLEDMRFDIFAVVLQSFFAVTFSLLNNLPRYNANTKHLPTTPSTQLVSSYLIKPFGKVLQSQRTRPLNDLLGFGPAEIGIVLVVALVLFGPETLKSLSKDVGRAAAELKEIPKTFKEGMEEGVQTSQVARMKTLAAEKRKKREEKLAAMEDEEDDIIETSNTKKTE